MITLLSHTSQGFPRFIHIDGLKLLKVLMMPHVSSLHVSIQRIFFLFTKFFCVAAHERNNLAHKVLCGLNHVTK